MTRLFDAERPLAEHWIGFPLTLARIASVICANLPEVRKRPIAVSWEDARISAVEREMLKRHIFDAFVPPKRGRDGSNGV